jgi:hypothetical protein
MALRALKSTGREVLRAASPDCCNPEHGARMTRYCFGEGGEQERSDFEEHLLQCDGCWREVQCLEASVRIFRTHRDLQCALWTPGVIGVLGISGRLGRLLGGHFWSLFVASILYALLFALSLVFEVACDFDHFGRSAWYVAVLAIFPGVVLSSLAGLALDWTWTVRAQTRGLWVSVLVACLSVGLVVIGAAQFLPDHPITLMRVQAYPAQAAYLKDTLYYLPLWVLFALIPFHAVLTFQRQLKNGHHRTVLSLLSGARDAFSPRGCPYLKVWHLAVLLVTATLASFYLTSNLFDNLRPTPHMNLFISLVQTRTLCYFALGVGLLFWYAHTLNEIKRECVAALSVALSVQRQPMT